MSQHQVFAFAIAAALASSVPAVAQSPFLDVGKQAPISVLINSSPWFASFEKVTQLYEKQTGNRVTLDVTPFPGMLEKARNDVRGKESTHDLLNLNNDWSPEFFEGGYIVPLKQIDPKFEMPKEVFRSDDGGYWSSAKHWRTSEGGEVYGFPPIVNLHLLYWRKDILDKAGVNVPETWEDVAAVCDKVQSKPAVYGYATRGERGNGVWYDFQPIMLAYGANVEKDPKNGDYTVIINSPEAKKALDIFVDIAKRCSPPNVGAIGQGDLIQSLTTGKLAMGHVVAAAWPNFDDPKKSAVVGKIEAAIMPMAKGGKVHGIVLGDWQLAVPKNIPDERKKAALAFGKWFLTLEAQKAYFDGSGIAVRGDVYTPDVMAKPQNRWMKAYLESQKDAKEVLGYSEGAAVEAIMGLRLNQAVIGELSTSVALNKMAEEIKDLFEKNGRKSGMLAKLPE